MTNVNKKIVEVDSNTRKWSKIGKMAAEVSIYLEKHRTSNVGEYS